MPKSFGTIEQPFIRDDLGRILKTIISLDKDLEELKQTMSLKTDFNVIDAYKLFICNGEEKKGVSLRQLEETFGFFHMYPTREEMTLLMLHYDLDADGKLL